MLARASNKHSEIAGCAEAVGYDFADIIERCYRDAPGGLHDLFALSQTGLDGAGSEGYAGWLVDVLQAIGDNRFGDQLSRESCAVQDTVRDYLLFDLGCPDFVTPPALKSQYPVTFPADTLVMEFEHSPYDTPEIDQAVTVHDHAKHEHDAAIVYTEVCRIPYLEEDVYIVRYDWDRSWWGDWVVVAVPYNGGVDWAATLDVEDSIAGAHGEMLPFGQSIHSVRSLWIEGQYNPLVEVIGVTHMGHGSIYLYELDIRTRTLRLVLTTFVLDMHEDNTLIKDGGVLQRTYCDVNGDGYTDVVFTGSATYYSWEDEVQQSGSEYDATPTQLFELRKVFLWSPDEDHFVTDRAAWDGFDQVYEGRE